MTAIYPRERVASVLRPLDLRSAYRILRSQYLCNPLGVKPGKTRFCDGTYGVLYAAAELATGVLETVVRDRFVRRDCRTIPFDDIRVQGWVEFTLPVIDPLKVVDLRDSGCVMLGAPTDAAHAHNQAAGRALGRAIHDQHHDIDGIWYRSRLTGGDCFAIFERALARLAVTRVGELEHHPELPEILGAHGIQLEK